MDGYLLDDKEMLYKILRLHCVIFQRNIKLQVSYGGLFFGNNVRCALAPLFCADESDWLKSHR